MAADIQNEMLAFVKSEFERYEKYHASRFKTMEKIYDYWIGKPSTAPLDWMNNVHVPIMFEGEQTITPRLYTALFPSDAPLDVKTEGDMPEIQGNKIKFLLHHYFRVANVQGEALKMLTQNVLYGTGYTEGGSWLVKRAWQADEMGSRYYAITDNRPDCKWVNFFEMYPHPAKLTMDDGLPIIRRRMMDAESLKAFAENPFFKFDNLDKALQSDTPLDVGKLSEAYQIKKGDEYEVLDYWGPWDAKYEVEGKIMTKKALPYWIIVINRKVVVRGIPNPYNHQQPPFTKCNLYPDAKPNWFGVGMGTIGKPIQERLNKIVNQRLDNVDLVLNPQGVYNAGDMQISKKKLGIAKPGQFHGVSDINLSIKWLQIPDVTAAAYQEEALAKQDFRESTGSAAQLMPTEKQHRTAMGISLLQDAAGQRFKPILRQIEIDFIQALAMFFFSNLKQFMTNAEWVTITGKQGQEEPIIVKPEDITGKVFFIPTGINETINKEIQVAQLLRFREITAQDPTINRKEINKRIAELMGFKDLPSLFVQKQPEPQGGQPGLSPEMQQQIDRRMAEGADPDTITREMLGGPPDEVGMQ